jgi:hypothetical protein
MRPGWWTVDEAAAAIEAGLADRMMLEMAPDKIFGVLSPAFKGNEVDYARQANASHGCTFFVNGQCEIHDTGLEPLECRFCHHDRMGQGIKCHNDIERDWDSAEGRKLVVRWSGITGFMIGMRS